jgi:hypothetical protein
MYEYWLLSVYFLLFHVLEIILELEIILIVTDVEYYWLID